MTIQPVSMAMKPSGAVMTNVRNNHLLRPNSFFRHQTHPAHKATPNIAMPQAIGNLFPFLHEGTSGYIASALLFIALAVVLARSAQKKVM